MSFRYNKRIKLGKGFGITISKSSITPSYRNKKGSVSTKGFAVRTGIPGLSYRKYFKKSPGCAGVFLIGFIFLVTALLISNTTSKEKSVRNDSSVAVLPHPK